MSTRQLGYFSISQNYEVGFTGPFDARLATPLKSELPTMSRAYPGMIVSVFADPTSSNNGVYFLDIPLPTGNPSITDWKKLTVGSAGITSLTTDTPDYLSFDLTTDPSIPKLTIGGTTTNTVNKLVARDGNGRAFAADPAVGSNDQTLATTAWVNTQLSSTFNFKGGFNANTGAIDGGGALYPVSDAARVAVSVGDTYVVTTSGNFFGNASTPLTIGDSVICQTAASVGASQESNFIVIQSDTDLATANTVGLGNVKPEDLNVSGEDPGISVRYSNGTAFVQNTTANNPYYQNFSTPNSGETVQPAGPAQTITFVGAGGAQVFGDNSTQTITIDTNPGGTLVTSGGNGTVNYMPIFSGQSSIVNSTLIYNPNQSRFVTIDGFQPGNLYLSPSDPGSQAPVSIYDKDGDTGSNGQVLTSDGSGVFWGDVASGNAYELTAQQVQLPGDTDNVLLTLNTGGQIDSQVTLIAGSNITLTRETGIENQITIASTASGGGGSMSSFTIDSNNQNFQTVTDGTDVFISGANGLIGQIASGPTIQLSVDYSSIGIINKANGGTLETLEDSDLFLFQDVSASANTAVKKGTLNQLKEYITGNVNSVSATSAAASTGNAIKVAPTTGAVKIQPFAFAGSKNVGHVPSSDGFDQTKAYLRADGTWVDIDPSIPVNFSIKGQSQVIVNTGNITSNTQGFGGNINDWSVTDISTMAQLKYKVEFSGRTDTSTDYMVNFTCENKIENSNAIDTPAIAYIENKASDSFEVFLFSAFSTSKPNTGDTLINFQIYK